MEPQPTAAKKPFFQGDPVTSIAAVVASFLLAQVMALLIVGLYPNLRNWTGAQATAWLDTIPAQFLYVLAAEVLSVAFVLKLVSWAKVKPSRVGLVRPKLIDIIYALAAYAGYFIVFFTVFTFVSRFIDVTQKQQLGFDSPTGDIQLLLAFISLVILPPIAEEIMFRGFLFSSLRAKFRLVPAVIVTSILFGLAHLQFGNGAPLLWIAAIDTFTLSCFLCYLREKTGSVWASVLLHMIKNGIAYLTLYHSKF
jgi:uncharacterized protein